MDYVTFQQVRVADRLADDEELLIDKRRSYHEVLPELI